VRGWNPPTASRRQLAVTVAATLMVTGGASRRRAAFSPGVLLGFVLMYEDVHGPPSFVICNLGFRVWASGVGFGVKGFRA
jgi:hypothetical protein